MQHELDVLIRARYPILYVLSPEEGRVVQCLLEIARHQQKKAYEWSCTTGLTPEGTPLQNVRARQSTTRDPVAALDFVLDHVEPALFIFKDLHPCLGKSHPQVIRKLKEIAQHLKNSHKTIALVSPVLEVPVELEKEITVVSFPLPNRLDLSKLLDQIHHDIAKFSHLHVGLDAAAREKLLQAALGLTLAEAENVFAKILVKRERLTGDDVDEVLTEKQQIIRKSGLLEYHSAQETFSDVGGLALLKGWLNTRALAFTERARQFGLPAPKGILLLGVQGCGKSLCAKAVASLWQLPLLRFDMGRMFGSFVGSSEENVRRAIAVAESVAPAILWVDEIDKAFAGAQGPGFSDSGTTARVFATFLTWLSEKTAPVFVVASANDISHLPPELLRKGRFDEIFFVDLPDASERQDIFAIHLAKRGRDPALFSLAALAEASVEFSGAEIEQAIISALYQVFAAGRDLETADIFQSIQQSVPLARTMQEQVVRLRHWAVGRARSANASGETQTSAAPGAPFEA